MKKVFVFIIGFIALEFLCVGIFQSLKQTFQIQKVEVERCRYSLGSRTMVPAKDMDAYRKMIVDLITASNNNLSAGDYEEPEYVMDKAEVIANKTFVKEVDGMYYDGGMSETFIPKYEFSRGQKIIYDNLLKNQ